MLVRKEGRSLFFIFSAVVRVVVGRRHDVGVARMGSVSWCRLERAAVTRVGGTGRTLKRHEGQAALCLDEEKLRDKADGRDQSKVRRSMTKSGCGVDSAPPVGRRLPPEFYSPLP